MIQAPGHPLPYRAFPFAGMDTDKTFIFFAEKSEGKTLLLNKVMFS
jgi:hypothetical protein